MRRRGRTFAALAGVVLLAACGPGGYSRLYDTPLPGGASLGDHSYHVQALFADVLDLVPQSAVKVNDVAVGRVDAVSMAADQRSASVSMTVNGDVQLPANARAELRQSSLLGEKFVSLEEPVGEQPDGALADGATIPLSRTTRNPEVEEVLGALSMLLNGGGVEQLATITRELNDALGGNEPRIRQLLSQVDDLATELDGQQAEITQAIDGLGRLSGTLVAQQGNATNALDNLEPGVRVAVEQRDQLVGMLRSLDSLSGVAVDTIEGSKDDVVADLRALQPTLAKLAEAGQNLPDALKIVATYPLPDVAGTVLKGDFGNVDVRLDLDLDSLLQNIERAGKVQVSLPGTAPPVTLPVPPLPLPSLTGPVAPLPIPQQTPGGSGLTGLLNGLLGGGG